VDIGSRIAKLREQKGINQTALSKKIGVEPPTISQYESNKREPRLDVLVEIAQALNTTAGFLITGDTEWTESKLYKKALDKYGFSSQIIMLAEECGELVQAISKLYRKGNPNPVYEEIADVQIMIEQVIQHYGEVGREQVHKYRQKKLARLEKMIEGMS